MSTPREVLGAMTAGVPGVVAASLIDMDGETLEMLKLDASVPVETVMQEVTTVAKLLLYMCRKLRGDMFEDFMVSGDRLTILAALPKPDRCVTLFLRGSGSVGRARVQLRRNLPELAAACGDKAAR